MRFNMLLYSRGKKWCVILLVCVHDHDDENSGKPTYAMAFWNFKCFV